MIKLISTLLLAFALSLANGQQLTKDQQLFVAEFISHVKNKHKDKIANSVSYPFTRQYPLPSIKDKGEFIKRYAEIFDDSLSKMIINSNPEKDWSEVGWRGISIGAGEVWLDDEGRLVAVNYESMAEQKRRVALIEKDRNALHASLKKFEQPICILETDTYRIRIDELSNGKYRYASWNIRSSMSEKPEIIIEDGEFIAEGSGGNHTYEFKNGEYRYECSIIEMGENDSPPAIVTIYKGEKELLTQKVRVLK